LGDSQLDHDQPEATASLSGSSKSPGDKKGKPRGKKKPHGGDKPGNGGGSGEKKKGANHRTCTAVKPEGGKKARATRR
jgi:hypothetical protein